VTPNVDMSNFTSLQKEIEVFSSGSGSGEDGKSPKSKEEKKQQME